MEEIMELWIPVPEAGGRIEFSTHGHFKVVVRKTSRFGRIKDVFDGENRKPVCCHSTGQIGWYVTCDKIKRFYSRDKLVRLFNESVPLKIDTSLDEELLDLHEARYETWRKEHSEKEQADAEPETQWKSPKGVPERWLPVEETGGRFAVSNYGHLKKISRKILKGDAIVTESCDVPIHIVADYKTGDMGWYVRFRDQKLFLRRDDIVSLFPEDERDVDTSLDEMMLLRREETGRALEEFVSERKQSREEHSSSAAE